MVKKRHAPTVLSDDIAYNIAGTISPHQVITFYLTRFFSEGVVSHNWHGAKYIEAASWFYLLGSSHYILRMTDPDRGFPSLSEEKNKNIKFLGQLMSEERKIKWEKLTNFQ